MDQPELSHHLFRLYQIERVRFIRWVLLSILAISHLVFQPKDQEQHPVAFHQLLIPWRVCPFHSRLVHQNDDDHPHCQSLLLALATAYGSSDSTTFYVYCSFSSYCLIFYAFFGDAGLVLSLIHPLIRLNNGRIVGSALIFCHGQNQDWEFVGAALGMRPRKSLALLHVSFFD
jgi:hypothetical protein